MQTGRMVKWLIREVERQNGMQPWGDDEKSGEPQAIILSRHWRCRAHGKEARRRRIKKRREDAASERRLPHLEELDALWRAAR
ncbi:MAG: hypothetical protein D6723_00050 [Acidobacteria bacterium]|nr:MAG: hypothetical protein D6723_00050 [Acidobacteriota bacterium]